MRKKNQRSSHSVESSRKYHHSPSDPRRLLLISRPMSICEQGRALTRSRSFADSRHRRYSLISRRSSSQVRSSISLPIVLQMRRGFIRSIRHLSLSGAIVSRARASISQTILMRSLIMMSCVLLDSFSQLLSSERSKKQHFMRLRG
jgi:hypothetical protein